MLSVKKIKVLLLMLMLTLQACTIEPEELTDDEDGVEQGDGNGGTDGGNPDDGNNGGGDPDDGGNNGGDDNTPPEDDAIPPGLSAADIFKDYVWRTSISHCIDCHGQQVVGQDPKITLLALTNGYPAQAHDATVSVVNFINLEQSLLLTTIQNPAGHPSGSPAITQQEGIAIAAEYMPELTAWRDARAREADEQNQTPPVTDGDINLGQTQYGQQCQGCHGANANNNQMGDGETYQAIFGFAVSNHNGNTCDRSCANNIGAYLCLSVWANVPTQCSDIRTAKSLSNLPTGHAFDFNVNEILGVLPSDHYGNSLVNNYYANSPLLETTLRNSAQSSAQYAVENNYISSGCSGNNEDTFECVLTFVDSLGERVLGRPLSNLERVDYAGYYYAVLTANGTHADATAGTLARLLQSQHFIDNM